MSDNGRKQISRSTIHLNSISSSQDVDGIINTQNFDWENYQHSEGRFTEDPSLININDGHGATETQPDQNNEEDSSRYWADNELDSSNSDERIRIEHKTASSDVAEGNSSNERKLRCKRKRKRTLNSVISKPRICKRRKEHCDSGADTSKVILKIPDWIFSNLPFAQFYRKKQEKMSSSESDDNILIERKQAWIKRRKSRSKKFTISYTSDSIVSEEEGACLCCITGPQDTILVHEDTGHLCCCYNCAKKLWELGVHCPVCGLQVTRIVDL